MSLFVLTIYSYHENYIWNVAKNNVNLSNILQTSKTKLDFIKWDKIQIEHDTDFIALGCLGDGIKSNPYRIENYNLSGAIVIANTTKFFTIKNCLVSLGIYIKNVSMNTAIITNNTCESIIEGVYSNYGIYVESSVNVTITNNFCIQNEYGIFLSSSNNCTIESNTCMENEINGIQLSNSNSSNIFSNICKNNQRGIIASFSHHCVISNNLLLGNTFSGNGFDYSNQNIIHHNFFVDNYPGFSQAYDYGENNIWYATHTLEGNFWSDWTKNEPYLISDLTGSSDPYPFYDRDDDDLNDYEEIYLYNINPLNNDTDSDGMPDGWEVINKLLPWFSDQNLDPDSDDLRNMAEYGFGTNPHKADTDEDGYNDGFEIKAGTNPLNKEEYPIEVTKTKEVYVSSLIILLSILSSSIVYSRKKQKKGRIDAKQV